jgi:small subunit ribosomal protein S9
MTIATTPVKKAVRKTPAAKSATVKKAVIAEVSEAEVVHTAPVAVEPKILASKLKAIDKDRYVFSTGRRKTAIANIRLFSGKGDVVVNKRPLSTYFNSPLLQDIAVRPFVLLGLSQDFYFTAHVSGGGIKAQAEALRHGLSHALSSTSEDIRKVLKKSGFITRDDRKKERKKPGLKRARRSPQWAKR